MNGGSFKEGATAAAGAEAAATAITRGLYGEEAARHPDLLNEDEKTLVRDLSAAVGAVASGLSGDSLAAVQRGGVVGRNAVENNLLSNPYGVAKLNPRERQLYLKLRTAGIQDVATFQNRFNQAQTTAEKDQIIQEYLQAEERAGQIIADMYKRGRLTDNEFDLLISSYAGKMMEGASEGEKNNPVRLSWRFWKLFTEPSIPYTRNGMSWTPAAIGSNTYIHMIRQQVVDHKDIARGRSKDSRRARAERDEVIHRYMGTINTNPDIVRDYIQGIESGNLTYLIPYKRGMMPRLPNFRFQRRRQGATTPDGIRIEIDDGMPDNAMASRRHRSRSASSSHGNTSTSSNPLGLHRPNPEGVEIKTRDGRTKTGERLTYQSNQKHAVGGGGRRPGHIASIEPSNSLELFERSVRVNNPNSTKRYTFHDGKIHQFSLDGSSYHWAGTIGKSDQDRLPKGILRMLGISKRDLK